MHGHGVSVFNPAPLPRASQPQWLPAILSQLQQAALCARPCRADCSRGNHVSSSDVAAPRGVMGQHLHASNLWPARAYLHNQLLVAGGHRGGTPVEMSSKDHGSWPHTLKRPEGRPPAEWSHPCAGQTSADSHHTRRGMVAARGSAPVHHIGTALRPHVAQSTATVRCPARQPSHLHNAALYPLWGSGST